MPHCLVHNERTVPIIMAGCIARVSARGGGQNRERGGAILTPNELVYTFEGSYICVNFGENRSRNATVRVPTDGQTDRRKPIL